jgi:hypothetical protein
MRRLLGLIGIGMALGILWLAPTSASAVMFPQCPPVDKDAGCKFLIVVSNSGVSVQEDPSQEPFYEGADDTLFGIENETSQPITQLPLSAPNDIFGFDYDGICDPLLSGEEGPIPAGCVVLKENAEHQKPEAGTKCGPQDGPCGFEPPAGEPLATTFAPGTPLAGYAKNGIPVTGYEGPTSWFSNVSSEENSGIVNFSPAIQPGESTYFGLEEAPSVLIGSPATLSTNLSGGGQSGASISVVQGTSVADTATVGGASAAQATGQVSYSIYSNAECTTLVAAAGTAGVSGGAAGASTAETTLGPGKYYWRASYSGDINNRAVSSECGSEVLTVLAPTSTSTVQTGGGVSGATIPVVSGSPVTDQAHVAGSLAASSTGSVTYALYKDPKCTQPEGAASVGVVTAGVAAPSAAVKPKPGTYYWVATYGGDAANAASASACGSEVLIVSRKASLGLPSGKVCLSRRKFVVHPRAPKHVTLVKVQVFINGKLVKEGHLSHRATTVSLVGLPKGTFNVELVTTSSKGLTYEDSRTFHTCVPSKHKKKKK